MINILEKAAKEAGEITLHYFQHPDLQVRDKGAGLGPVTQADTESQAKIKEIILSKLGKLGVNQSSIGFIGEEDLDEQKHAEHLFIIDPLDGTNSFVEGSDRFCVSIGYFKNGEPEAAAIYVPVAKTLYIAQKNQGAFKIFNGEKTRLEMQTTKLTNAKVVYNSSSNIEVREKVQAFVNKLTPLVHSAEHNRCCVITVLSVVNNEFNIAINGKCYLWDIAAVSLIVYESGGVMQDLNGGEFVFDLNDTKHAYEILVTTEECLESFKNNLFG